MARVLLINPPWVIGSDKNLWKRIASSWPSLGLLYIAAVLEKDGNLVKYLDLGVQHYSIPETKKILSSYKLIDYVLITATTPLINNALSIASLTKKIFKKSKVVFGGVHPSVMPKEVLSNSQVDFVVIDEGENTAKELIRGVAEEKILGLGYKKKGKIFINPDRPLISDLNQIPAPAYHLIKMKDYYPAVGSYKRLPAMSIFATRGCPGRCTFCYRTFRGRVRKRSAENILAEIKLLKDNYGIREISFYDDTFTLFKDEITKFCHKMIEEKMEMTWSCFTRVDYIDSHLLKIMKKAGCHLILFGVESANQIVLENIHKNISLTQTKNVVKMAKRIGIETRVSFMIGNKGETEESIRETIDFAIDLDPDEVQFNITTPYPGTELYNWAKKKGYIRTNNWNQYSISNVVMELPDLPKEKLQYYYELAHRKFYFRPKIIFRRLFKIRTRVQFIQEIKGFFALMNFVFNKIR